MKSFLIPILEIAILTAILSYVFSLFWNNRGKDLLIAILAFVVLYGLTTFLHLPVLQKIMQSFVNVGVLAAIVLFQPELRRGLSRAYFKGRKYSEISEFDNFLEGMAHATYHLAERRTGALIAIENQDSLEEFANKAIPLYAEFTPELLESVFISTSPLHDGGVIVRGTTILSAATIFPLAEESIQIIKPMGTRHRAALGMAQVTDALVIVISEETGRVSIARDGILTRGVKIDRFKGIMRSIFTPIRATGGQSTTFFQHFKLFQTKRSS